MTRTIVATLTLLLIGLSTAYAQTDFSTIPVEPGDQISVVLTSGVVVSGHATSITPTLLTIGNYEFAPEPGLRVDRRGDSILSGTVIGAGVGAFIFAFGICRDSACIASGAFSYGLFGALLDWAHVGSKTIYRIKGSSPVARRSLAIAPVITTDHRSLSVSVSF